MEFAGNNVTLSMDEFNALIAVLRAAESGNGVLMELAIKHYQEVNGVRQQSPSWRPDHRS